MGFVGLRGYHLRLVGENNQEKCSRLLWGKAEGPAVFSDALYVSAATCLLILNIQATTYDFLINCCLRIFSDVSIETLFSGDVLVHSDPGRPITTRATLHGELATEIAAAQYNTPSDLDTGRLLRLIEARKDELEDHIYDLREDPAYFASAILPYVNELCDFRTDTDRLAAREWNNDVWKHSTLTMLCDVYSAFLMWDILYQQAQGLHNASSKGFQDLNQEDPLDPDLETKFVEFIHVLQMLIHSALHNLSVANSQSDYKNIPKRLKISPKRFCVMCDEVWQSIKIAASHQNPLWTERLRFSYSRPSASTQILGQHQ